MPRAKLTPSDNQLIKLLTLCQVSNSDILRILYANGVEIGLGSVKQKTQAYRATGQMIKPEMIIQFLKPFLTTLTGIPYAENLVSKYITPSVEEEWSAVSDASWKAAATRQKIPLTKDSYKNLFMCDFANAAEGD